MRNLFKVNKKDTRTTSGDVVLEFCARRFLLVLVIKLKDIGRIHQALNKFDKNLRFTVDKFDDVALHFFDL